MSNKQNKIADEAEAESNEDKGAIAIAIDVPVEDLLPDIFKLQIEHFEEIFDWLNLDELLTLGQTCKQLRSFVGYFFREYYKKVRINCTDKGLRCPNVGDWIITGFSPYIRDMVISGDNWQTTIESNRFYALKKIALYDASLTDDKIACIKDILGKCTDVTLCSCKMNNEFFTNFLTHCISIKELCIVTYEPSEIMIGTDNSWLLHEYPTLERLELLLFEMSEIKELKTFFEQNSTVKWFLTTSEFLWSNKNIIRATKKNLDVLIVKVTDRRPIRSSLYVLLKELYEKGFYKQLTMSFRHIDQQDVTEMVSNAGLVGLCAIEISNGIDLSPLVNLKELYLSKGINGSLDLESLAKELVNLERLEYKMANSYLTYPFLRLSRKLKKIIFHGMLDCMFDPVELLTMNKEREKLANARKVIIYVPEYVYLMNKWEDETSLSLVELKRSELEDGR